MDLINNKGGRQEEKLERSAKDTQRERGLSSEVLIQ